MGCHLSLYFFAALLLCLVARQKSQLSAKPTTTVCSFVIITTGWIIMPTLARNLMHRCHTLCIYVWLFCDSHLFHLDSLRFMASFMQPGKRGFLRGFFLMRYFSDAGLQSDKEIASVAYQATPLYVVLHQDPCVLPPSSFASGHRQADHL